MLKNSVRYQAIYITAKVKYILKTALYIFSISILLTSCAHNFYNFGIYESNFGDSYLSDGLTFAYKYHILNETSNPSYATKEASSPIKLLAVKITNRTARTIRISDDIIFLKNNQIIQPSTSDLFLKNVEQNSPIYILYLALTPLKLTHATHTSIQSYPIGLILGPALAFGNIFTASNANSKLLNTINQYDVLSRWIFRVVKPSPACYVFHLTTMVLLLYS